MTRMEAGDSVSRSQQNYQSEVSSSQPIADLLDARWKEQFQKCNQGDAHRCSAIDDHV